MSDSPITPLICPKCHKTPQIMFLESLPKEIEIHCIYCGYKKTKILWEYLDKIKNFDRAKIKNSTKGCEKHPQEVNNFCIECNLYLCNFCNKEKHMGHQIISLINILPTVTLNKKIRKAEKHINNYCLNIKNQKVKELSNQILDLEESYKDFKETNQDILTLLDIIIKNYENDYSNVDYKINVGNIINVNLYHCKSSYRVDNILKYFNNYKLLTVAPYVNTFKHQIMSKVIDEHNGPVNSIELLTNGKLVSCSSDRKIRIFNMNNDNNCDITINEYIGEVRYVCKIDKSTIVSCSDDNSIRIWTVFKKAYLCRFCYKNAHWDLINKVIPLTNNRIASCSRDKTIGIWSSVPPYESLHIFVGHTKNVFSIIQLKDKEYIISGSEDLTLRIWNISIYQCYSVIKGVECIYTNSLLEYKNKVIVGGFQKITIVNLDKCIIEKEAINKDINRVNSLLHYKDGMILCGCVGGFVCLFNVNDYKFTFQKTKLHSGQISCLLKINDNKIISSSYDNTIKINSFKTIQDFLS